ncbi:MAG: phosphopentomutase [Chlamydiales bacterium]|jgi:phosphopentomutase
MTRVFVIVLDSLGVGALPDAGGFGESGCHTLDHIVAAAGRPVIPRLERLGLGCIEGVTGIPASPSPAGSFGRMAERSPGKDTLTGHWEMMGCPLEHAFPVFPDGFPAAILDELVSRAKLPGVLCNEPASGTEVIERLGPEHLSSGKPIVYTSADSVLQIAAHEERFGLERLYEVSSIAREIVRPHGVARVIARPFVGKPGAFERTYNRRDYSLEPPRETVLDRLLASGIDVTGIGKIEDIFAGRGITRSLHSEGNRDGMRLLTEAAQETAAGFYFVNLVDFDMLYGHRRDPIGYRRALEEFDVDLVTFEATLRPNDLVFLTADHGNDPTHQPGTDHTREYVPVIAYGSDLPAGVNLGTRTSFADLGATVEQAFGLPAHGPGRSFL